MTYQKIANKELHIWIAENALGHSLPKGSEVHHVDENPFNNIKTNLIICEDKKYHRLLHARQRILKLGYDPNKYKICGMCQLPKLRSTFYITSRNYDGLKDNCFDCCRIYDAKRYKIKHGKAF